MAGDQSGADVLKFPRLSGWVHLKTGYLTKERLWMVLCNKKLYRYRHWTQEFPDMENMDISTNATVQVGGDYFKVGEFTFQAENTHQKDMWIHSLRSVDEVSLEADVHYSIDQFMNLLQTKRKSENYREVMLRLLGILSISKDAQTSSEDLAKLVRHLKNKGFAQLLCCYYANIFDQEKMECVTDDMLQRASMMDDADDLTLIIYSIRRLLWRFAFTDKLFAYEMASTSYVKYLSNDIRCLVNTPINEWQDGNYLLFNTLDSLQQVAKSPCKRDVFYESGTLTHIEALRKKNVTAKVQMAAIFTLSFVVKDIDINLLKTDEELLNFYLAVCRKAIENGDHCAKICNVVKYYTTVQELMDALCKMCRLETTRKLLLQKNVTRHINTVSSDGNEAEVLPVLRLIEMICKSSGGRSVFRSESELITRIASYLKSDNDTLSQTALRVYDLLRTREPRYVRQLGPEAERLYTDALREGSAQDNYIRVILVGHAGAGKTTLLKRLMGQDIIGIQSTEGIDLHMQKFLVDLSTGTWKTQINEDCQDGPDNKLAKAIKEWEANNYNPHNSSRLYQETGESPSINLPVGSLSPSRISSNSRTETQYEEQQQTNRKSMENETESLNERKKRIHKNFKTESLLELPEDFAFVSFMDFAGEEIYYATHHAYMSPNAIYLVVLDLSEVDTKLEAMRDKAVFWMRSIMTYASFKEESDKFICPPVLVVATHKDGVLQGKDNDTKVQYAKEKINALFNIPMMKGISKDIVQGCFFVDNTDDNEEAFEQIKKVILKSALEQQEWNRMVPIKWLACAQEVSTLQRRRAFMNKFELKRHLHSLQIEEDGERFEEMLRYLHNEGKIMYFSNSSPEIKDIIILRPHWLVNAFKKIVGITTLDRYKEQQTMLKAKGMLEKTFVKERLKEMTKSVEENRTLLLFLEELNLIGNISPSHEHFVLSGFLESEDLSSFLSRVLPGRGIVSTSAYCYDFGENFVPDILYDKVITACVSKWSIAQSESTNLIKRGKGLFKVDETLHLLIVGEGSNIQLSMFKRSFDDGCISIDRAQDIRTYITETIRKALDSSSQENVKFVECLQCRIQESSKSWPVLIDDLFTYRQMYCCKRRHDEEHKLTVRHLQHWFKKVPEGISYGGVPPPDSEVFYTPPQSLESEEVYTAGSNKFKRSYDSAYQYRQLRILNDYCGSVGLIKSPVGTATCFRVGECYIMTSYHIIYDIINERSIEGVTLCPGRLESDHVYVEFVDPQNLSHHRFHISMCINFYDVYLDVAVLSLKVDDSTLFPIPFKKFSSADVDERLTFIGYGHTKHTDDLMCDLKVKLLPRDCDRVRGARDWVMRNEDWIRNAFYEINMPFHYDIRRSYEAVDQPHHIAFDSFMEKGSSGAPGIKLGKWEPEVVVMVTGGLPDFFFDMNQSCRDQFPRKNRFEFGVTMDAVRRRMIDVGYLDLAEQIFGRV